MHNRGVMVEKIILIARVSDVEQRQALPAQKLRLQDYAQKFETASVSYFEFDESAYKGARQKFSELIGKIKGESIKQIVVFDKIDRFTRDASQKEVGIMSSLVQKGPDRASLPFRQPDYRQEIRQQLIFFGSALACSWPNTTPMLPEITLNVAFEQMWHEGLFTHKAPIGYKHTRKYVGSLAKPVKGIVVDSKVASFCSPKPSSSALRGFSHQTIADQLGEQEFISPKTGQPYKHSIISKILSQQVLYRHYVGRRPAISLTSTPRLFLKNSSTAAKSSDRTASQFGLVITVSNSLSKVWSVAVSATELSRHTRPRRITTSNAPTELAKTRIRPRSWLWQALKKLLPALPCPLRLPRSFKTA